MEDQTLSKRIRLYCRYKAQQVSTEDLVWDHQKTPHANYVTICHLRSRLLHCLEARKEVHRLYGDGDEGHKLAITFVEAQVVTADNLLEALAQRMYADIQAEQEAAAAIEIENVEEPTKSLKADKVKKAKKVVPTIEETCHRLREESEVLNTWRDEAEQKMRTIYHRIWIIITTDDAVSLEMRQMATQTKDYGITELFVMMDILTSRFVVGDLPLNKIIHKHTYERLAYFYYNQVEDKALRNFILRFQQQVVNKRHLVESLPTKEIHAGLKLFNTCFSAASSFTTLSTCNFVVELTASIHILVQFGRGACRRADDFHRSVLVKEHGEGVVNNIDTVTRQLMAMSDPKNAWSTVDLELPWAAIRFAKLFVHLILVASQFMVEGMKKQPFV